MYVNTHTIQRPPQDLLDQCHRVELQDPKAKFWQMKRWCREQHLSLVWSDAWDLSDFSATYDTGYEFYFIDDKDATIFTLKFK